MAKKKAKGSATAWMWQTPSGRIWVSTASRNKRLCREYVEGIYFGVLPPGKPVRVRITPVEAAKGKVKHGK